MEATQVITRKIFSYLCLFFSLYIFVEVAQVIYFWAFLEDSENVVPYSTCDVYQGDWKTSRKIIVILW